MHPSIIFITVIAQKYTLWVVICDSLLKTVIIKHWKNITAVCLKQSHDFFHTNCLIHI